MNRREVICLTALASTALGFRSCNPEQQNTLALLTQVLGNAVADLIQIAGNPTLAATLREHTNTAVTLLRAWTPGQSVIDIIRALNRIIDDLSLFPALDKFQPLITLVLGTVAAIIEELQRIGNAGDAPHTKIRITAPPKTSDEFKHDWDAIRAGSPNMHDAPIL